MNHKKYVDWQNEVTNNWSEKDFGKVSPGSAMYYSQTFNFTLKNQSNILEIGYGNGSFLEYFKNKGHIVYGTEINDILIDRGKNAGYKVFNGWACDVKEFDELNFDLIALLDVAEHLTLNELEEFFLWASHRLTKEGILCLRFPEGSSPFGLSYQNGDFTHISTLTKTKISYLCQQNNLTIINYKDDKLSSNKMCSFGILGKLTLLLMQFYSYILKLLLKIIFYPLGGMINLATNSIVIISKK